MKKLVVLGLSAVLLFAFAGSASAKTHVSGYSKKSGTHVSPHYRTDKDHRFNNNWSTKGNVNPYTGKKGYKTHR